MCVCVKRSPAVKHLCAMTGRLCSNHNQRDAVLWLCDITLHLLHPSACAHTCCSSHTTSKPPPVPLPVAAAAAPPPPPSACFFTSHPPQCFHQIMVGIYFLQAMILCVLLVKKFPYALFVLPLIVFTIVFHMVQSAQFRRPWRLGNAREAALLDARDHVSVSFSWLCCCFFAAPLLDHKHDVLMLSGCLVCVWSVASTCKHHSAVMQCLTRSTYKAADHPHHFADPRAGPEMATSHTEPHLPVCSPNHLSHPPSHSLTQAPVSAEEAEATRVNYLSPVYKIDEVEHRKLIEEAAQVSVCVVCVYSVLHS